MRSLTWDTTSYSIDGARAFLISGEIQYFRTPKSGWEERLTLLKEAGGNCVATYVPWILHEPAEGDIRFGDCPERDLEEFLVLCGKLGLLVICRPGPYQYAELRYDGLPGWLCEGYPQILARDIESRIFRGSSVSYLHPLFLEKARCWYATVSPILARHTISRGGPVAMVQVDNELMGIHEWFGGWDYNSETMGFGREDGRFPQFLAGRYGDISALNRAYSAAYSQFSQVTPRPEGRMERAVELRRAKDYQDFYLQTIAEYVQTLSQWLRQDGVDCQIVHNSANPNMNAYFLETARRLGAGLLLGADHYYNLDQDWSQNNPTPQYAINVFYSNEMLRLMGYPATVFELPGGSFSDWPPVTPEDLLCCYMTNTALGMKGSNYYIFTGGPNPKGVSHQGDIYDYGASIGPFGEIRPTYAAQQAYGRFLTDQAWLAGAEREADFSIGLDWDQSRSRHYFGSSSEDLVSNTEAWSFVRKGILTTAFCASYAANFVDLATLDIAAEKRKPLVVAASACMAADRQRMLVRYVEQGGSVLLAPVIPWMDENLQPCTLLGDFLQVAGFQRCATTSPVITVGPVRNILMNGSLWTNTRRPPAAQAIATESSTGQELGWRIDTPAGGQVLWLGLHWKHSKHEHVDMLRYLLATLGCEEPLVRCSNPNVWTSLRSDGTNRMLFVMNLLSARMSADVAVRSGDRTDAHHIHVELKPMEVLAIRVD